MTLSIEEINKLEKDNERLRKEVTQWEHEYNILDACIELYQMVLKEKKQTLFEIKKIAENQDLYRGRQALATKILQIINRSLGAKSDEHKKN